MRYKKFIINSYRGLHENTIINISKTNILPIIGKNESGKTTCLEAIYAFDSANDSENEGKHLKNIENLYSTSEKTISISAEIEIDKDFNYEDEFKTELKEYLNEFEVKNPDSPFNINEVNIENYKYSKWQFVKALQIINFKVEKKETITIKRDLINRKYEIDFLTELVGKKFSNSFGDYLVQYLPFTLYFDDFRDRIPNKLYIIKDNKHELYSNWIKYIDELFQDTKEEYSVFSIVKRQDSIRRSILKEVERHLNKKLISEWSKYQFESSNNINLRIEYIENQETPYLQFKIVEIIKINEIDEERFFDISDRSKGFYWYLNFMIKLHFNPSKRRKDDNDTVYLLDEPGSYLHTFALNKLAEQIKNLSISNKVIYCTHAHNLLNPNFIPINCIHLADKNENGIIQLKKLDHKGLIRPNKNSAYQAIYDALEVKPPLVEYDFQDVVLLEGIYDFYSFKMFTTNVLSFFPCVSASSIINQIPYMIFLDKRYLALWDNDTEGRERLKKAIEIFGEIEGNKFLTLSLINSQINTRLEEYYDEKELKQYNLEINGKEQSFEKTVLSLFYSTNRQHHIDTYFQNTISNFKKMEILLIEKLHSQ